MESFLLAAWIVTQAAAFVLGRYSPDRTRYARRPILLMGSALLAALAWLYQARSAPGTLPAASAGWVALGMSASFVGDVCLGGQTTRRVLLGMLAFGLAHGLYLGGWLSLGSALPALAAGSPAGFVLGGGGGGLVLWAGALRSRRTPAPLTYGALGYAVLIGVMASLTVWLTLADPRLWPLALGAALFVLSDFLLARRLLRGRRWPHQSDVIWVLYICGQALIVCSGRWLPAGGG